MHLYIPYSTLQTLHRFLLISVVVQRGFKNIIAHASGDPAYRKDDDIELRKQPLTAVTGFGLLGQRSDVTASIYSTLLQTVFCIFFP